MTTLRLLRAVLLSAVLCLARTHVHAKILRNNALMNRMMSDFHKDKNNNNIASAETTPPDRDETTKEYQVVSRMQNVLCRNFPTIPCKMIMEDQTLKDLIEKSIQQINFKKLSMGKTTPIPGYHLTLFPTVNSEDLSNFLDIRETGYFTEPKKEEIKPNSHKKKKQKKTVTTKPKPNHEHQHSHSKTLKGDAETKHTSVYTGRKKLRKFYPHKIKYKDKMEQNEKDFRDFSDEKLSMSLELPDGMPRKHPRMEMKESSPADPVWRIDYLKHGEPSLNKFGFGTDQLKGKITKTGDNVIVDENIIEQAARKDVLHPDVYIKKNMGRKNSVDLNSDNME